MDEILTAAKLLNRFMCMISEQAHPAYEEFMRQTQAPEKNSNGL